MMRRDTARTTLDNRQSVLGVAFAAQIGQPTAFPQVRLATFAPRLCWHLQPLVPIDLVKV